MRVAGFEIGVSELLALVALIISGLSYWANRGMAAANRSMAQSNLTMAETNKSMALSAEVSAQAARDAVEVQHRAEQLSNKACLHLARDQGDEGLSFRFHDVEEEEEDDYSGTTVPQAGWITFHIRNEGEAPALSCRLELHAAEHGLPATPIRGESDKRIGPREVGQLGFSTADLPQIDHALFYSVVVDFEDRLGADQLILGITFYPSFETFDFAWGFEIIREVESMSPLCRHTDDKH